MYINRIISQSHHNQDQWSFRNPFERNPERNYAICRASYYSDPSPKITVLAYITDFVIVKQTIIVTESEDGNGDCMTDEHDVCEAIHFDDGFDGGYGVYHFLVEYSAVPTTATPRLLNIAKQTKHYDDLCADYQKNREHYDQQQMIPNVGMFRTELAKLKHQYYDAVTEIYC